MTNYYIFADEAGCFAFNRNHNISKYFILCTISMNNCDIGYELLELRRKLIWAGNGDLLGDYFHATSDKQAIRDKVYEVIASHDFKIQATIMEKAKAQPHVIANKSKFYQYGWYYHFKHGMPSEINNSKGVLVSAASLGTKKEKMSFSNSINSVMHQTLNIEYKVDFRPCKADPCLQVADYCAWAIQRKWEKNCIRSYDLIKSKITREYDLWERGGTLYY